MIDDELKDELKTVPSITLDKEDIRESVDAGAMSESKRSYQNLSQQKQNNQDKVVLALGFVILLVLAAVSYLYISLQNANKEVELTRARIEKLESRLSSTDTTITQSEVLLANKLTEMEGLIGENKNQVKKLWGVSYDANRKAIEKNKQTNSAQQASLKKLTAQIGANQKVLNTQKTKIGQLSAVASNSESSAREAVQRMELMQETVAELETGVSSTKSKQAQLESGLKKRIATLEDTAKSTDVFRRNTQTELRKLREELVRLSAPKIQTKF